MKKKRLQIDVTPKQLDSFERMQGELGATTAEVCRKSFRLLETMLDYSAMGFTLVLKNKKGEEFPFPIKLL